MRTIMPMSRHPEFLITCAQVLPLFSKSAHEQGVSELRGFTPEVVALNPRIGVGCCRLFAYSMHQTAKFVSV